MHAAPAPARARLALLYSLLAAAAAQLYSLDAGFPAPGALPPGVSRVTAVAVVAATSGGGATEVHVAQRNASVPYFLVLDAASGALLRAYNGSLVSPHGALAGGADGSVWVTDIEGGHVQQYAAATGALLRSVGTPGKGVHPPQFSAVADVALTAAGDVLVADGDGGANNRLLLLRGTNLSDVLWSVGGAGAGPGLFSSPHSVAYEPGADRALVADRGNARIQFLAAADGRVLGQWALAADCGLPAGALPWGLRVDAPRERLLVVDGATGHFYALALPAQRPGRRARPVRRAAGHGRGAHGQQPARAGRGRRHRRRVRRAGGRAHGRAALRAQGVSRRRARAVVGCGCQAGGDWVWGSLAGAAAPTDPQSRRPRWAPGVGGSRAAGGLGRVHARVRLPVSHLRVQQL